MDDLEVALHESFGRDMVDVLPILIVCASVFDFCKTT
jgi:hypothetical protein